MTSSKWSIVAATLAGTAAFLPQLTLASSHREAPAIAGMPRVDGTDFYMFRSYEPGRQDYVTLIANYIPIQAPYGGPNYFTLDHDAHYEIKIDSDGDAVEDMTFRFTFDTALANSGKGIALTVGTQTVGIPLRNAGAITDRGDPNINESESFKVDLLTGTGRSAKSKPLTRVGNSSQFRFTKPIDNIGNKSIPDYAAYANQHIYDVTIPGCATPGRVFVGQRAEAFAVNLGAIFDLVNLVPIEGDSAPGAGDNGGFPGGITQNRAQNDDLVGKANVTSLALEVPIACVTGNGNGVIGAWTTASLPTKRVLSAKPDYNATEHSSHSYTQVSRLSAPLVNEVVIGLKDKDKFNESEPKNDSVFATYVTNPTLPALLNLLFRDAVNATLNPNPAIADLAPTNFPRKDLVTAFLTGFDGLNRQKIVKPSEMMRLNTAIPATPRDAQQSYGVVAEDLAGFPNGRRPGDDTVDIALRVVMGALCHDVPLGAELGVPGAVEDTPSDLINLGLCTPADASVGNVPFTDGAPISALDVLGEFPYLNPPLPGSHS
ncbi:MAG: DUF4331 domain-containing protein [Paracoccaceae bacterium]